MITVNIYYTGEKGAARAFAEEMVRSGVAEEIRREEGNLRYEYFFPMEDPETVLLIDQWRDQSAVFVTPDGNGAPRASSDINTLSRA